MSDNQISPIITRRHIVAAAFFAAVLFFLYQAALILTPFFAALLWAAVLVLALRPLHRKTLALLRGKAGVAAFVMTLLTFIVAVGPAVALLVALASQATGLYQWAAGGVQSGAFAEFQARIAASLSQTLLSHPLLAEFDIKGALMKAFGQLSSGVASGLGGLLKSTALLVLNLLIMCIALFFFFRDGERYYREAFELLPFPETRKESVARKFHDTFIAVVNGVVLIALGQGVMTGIGFAVFQVPFPALWGFAAAVLALLPIGGAALVWVPGVCYLVVTDATLRGILLALWGALLVSLPDNFLKPLLIGKKAKLPSFLLFLGILGGLQVYGFLGILFGPLVVTALFALMQIYREEYAEKHEAGQ